MRLFHKILIAAIPPIITISVLLIAGRLEGGHALPPDAPEMRNANELAKLGLGFVDTLDSFLLAGLAGLAAFAYKLIERNVMFTTLAQVLLSAAIGLFLAGLIAGYQARTSGLRMVAGGDAFLIDRGAYHVASSMQSILLLVAVSVFGILFLALVHSRTSPRRRDKAVKTDPPHEETTS